MHLGFRLDADGGFIGLSADRKTIFEGVSYTEQAEDNSYGRYKDGTGNWVTFENPTPGKRNSYPPEIISEPLTVVDKDEEYNYNIIVSDEDGDDLSFGIYELPWWLDLTVEGNHSALLSGTSPSSDNLNAHVKVFVTDGYTRPVIHEFVIRRPQSMEEVTQNYALKQFKTYPNPAKGLINIEAVMDSKVLHIAVSAITGQTLYFEQIINDTGTVKTQFDLSAFKEGVYFITFRTEKGTFTNKIVLIK